MSKKTLGEIEEEFVQSARVSGQKTNNPVVVAIVGVTGVGNSTIASALEKKLGWSVIENNKIRVALREKGSGFTPETTAKIGYAMLGKILRAGGNAILDSDFADKNKRKKLERFAKNFRARVIYLRLVCDRDTMIERIIHARYNSKTDIFKNAVIAVREHSRRLPWHYRWTEKGGGQFLLKKLPVKFLAEIDTTDPRKWPKKLGVVAEKLKKN
ncbi:MAG: AAA family ATPase [Patescibacteria group bacterium]